MTNQTHPSIPIGYWIEAFRKFATFSGRARRAEYWSFTLMNIIIAIVLFALGGLGDSSMGTILYGCYTLATIIPGIAVAVRRLHDSGRSGWYFLLAIIPIINLLLLYYMLVDSQPGSNEYGPNPKGT
jgi:uncharacterized membrane protein YhaH (DUF805 family)